MIRLLPRRCPPVLVGLATLAVALLASAPAVAAAPEAPETLAPSAVTASTATLQGLLNPGKEGAPLTFELDTYEFLYRQSSATCEGESKAPEPSGISLGGGMEAVAQEVSGLQADTEYTVCLLVRTDDSGETAVGAPVTFRTTPPLQTPETKPADEITAEGATLHAVLNPTGPGDAGRFWFQYRRSPSECQGSEAEERETAPQPTSGQQDEAVEANVRGLLPGATYTFCVRTVNEARESALGQPETFTTPASAPSIASEEYSGVNSGEALVGAVIATNGTPATYRVEYGPTAAYGSSTPEASAGAGSDPTHVQVPLTGLSAAATYHFRFVVTYGGGSAEGVDQAFSTLVPGIQGLPDGRGYEMVTPASNENAEAYVPEDDQANAGFGRGGIETQGIFQSAIDGDAVAYVGSPTSTGNGLSGGGLGNQFLATRSPGGGWTQRDLQPQGYMTPEFQAVSRDLTRGMVSSCDKGLPPLAPDAPKGYDVLYRHTLGGGPYEPMFTVKPPNRPPGESFRSFDVEAQYGWCSPTTIAFAGASADYEQLLFVANDALTPNAKDGGAEENNLYDYADGQTSLVNVLPDGTTEPNATFGGPQLPSEQPSTQEAPDFDHVISADGSRVFWTDLNNDDLYMRENATQPQSPLGPAGECLAAGDACTVQVDASQGPGGSGGGRFWAATGDGSEVFFTDCSRLTNDSTAVAGGDLLFMSMANLTGYQNHEFSEVYRYDAQTRSLTCVSCNPSGEAAHGNSFVPIGWGDTFVPPWMSEDGARVFFDSPEALVASDSDGRTDVYEWESVGTGSCREGPGCLYLISSGTSTADSLLAAVSPTGDDVFFATRAQLVAQDENQNFNLFDARVGAITPPVLPICSGTGCQGVPPAPPIFATPASATFAGVGDFEPRAQTTAKTRSKPVRCRRGSVSRKGRCVKRRVKPRGKRAGRRSSRRSEQRRKR
jgi:hypothetical protein